MGNERIAALEAWAAARGYRVACGSAAVLSEVRRDLAERYRSGQFDGRFHRSRLTHFDYGDPVPAARAVILVAVPRPAYRVTFELDSGPFVAVVPPTYVDDCRLRVSVLQDLKCTVMSGCHLERLNAPLKAAAARLGLVKYGLNNISYVAGFGSYFQPVGYITEADLGLPADGTTAAPAVMAECENCGICRSICPTGAMDEDRFLLHQERCLTFLNEERDDWPATLPPSAHNCLVGCLICQDSCPENAGLLRIENAPVSFTRNETTAILASGARITSVWQSIRAKLEVLELGEYEPVLSRNLRALVAQRS